MAIFESNLRYGLINWGGTGSTLLKQIEVLQRKAVRSIAGIRIGDNSAAWFKKLSILTLKDLYKIEASAFAHKYRDSPLFFTHQQNARNPTGQSRRGFSLAPPKWIRSSSRSQAPYALVIEYNRVPKNIGQIRNYKAFRRKLKEKALGNG